MNKCTTMLQASKHDNVPATPGIQDYAKLNMITKGKDKDQTENVSTNKQVLSSQE